MKTFREHILEDEYTKVSGEVLLDVNNIIDNDESLPIYTNEKSQHIYTITPINASSPIIRLRMYDFVLRQSSTATVYINDVKDKEVDFMEDEYIEKAVKYMKETIKNENV